MGATVCKKKKGDDFNEDVAEDEVKNAEIHQTQQKDAEEDSKIHKLLLLGPGESGKSTFWKQMRLQHGDGIPEEDRVLMVPNVRENVIVYLATLVNALTEFVPNTTLPQEDRDLMLSFKVEDNVSRFVAHLSPDSVELLTRIWRHPDVQFVWKEKGAATQVPESTAYFLDERLPAICQQDYVPTDDDCLKIRIRTTGVLRLEFQIAEEQFLLIDMGGQRSERRKWIRFFDNAVGVLFLCDIGSFDRVVFEDEKTNRVHEALELYEWIINHDSFRRSCVILFLNKVDLFNEKVQHQSLKVCFPEYDGPEHDPDAAFNYVVGKFKEKWKFDEKQFFFHATCATDTNNCEVVFTFVKEAIVKLVMGDAGVF